MAETHTEHTVNGLDVDVLHETVQAIERDPDLAKCKFRVSNQWVSGGHNRTTVKDYYGCKQENKHKEVFTLDADEPPVLAGEDQAPNPVEYLLNALAGCVTTSMVAHAAVRGIQIEELESELEGDLDLRGFLGLSNTVPKGYTNIRIKFKVKTDEVNLEKLKKFSEFSPVLNTLTQGVKVDIDFEQK